MIILGDVSAHTCKAKHNEKFFRLVETSGSSNISGFPDWMVTISFYIALQWVDSKLAVVGTTPEERHPGNHSQRNTAVAAFLPRETARDYFFLKAKSEYARYIPGSENDITPNMVQSCVSLALSRFGP